VLKCPECHAPVAPDYKQCKYCKSYLVIERPEQLASLDDKEDGLKQYQNYFNEALARNPQDFNAIFGLGLWYFTKGLYTEARKQFELASKIKPTHADIYYYHALTFLNGKRPRVQRLSEIEELEKFLEVASQIDPSNALFDYFKAIVKYDYYVKNGLKIKPPSVKNLLKEAKNKTIDETERDRLFRYLKIKDDFLKLEILHIPNPEEKKKRRAIRVFYGIPHLGVHFNFDRDYLIDSRHAARISNFLGGVDFYHPRCHLSE
jgi:tetratricopeptide (TPR) repeat protein